MLNTNNIANEETFSPFPRVLNIYAVMFLASSSIRFSRLSVEETNGCIMLANHGHRAINIFVSLNIMIRVLFPPLTLASLIVECSQANITGFVVMPKLRSDL